MKNRDANKKHKFMLGLMAVAVTAVLAFLFFNNEDQIITNSINQVKSYYKGMKTAIKSFQPKMN